MSKKKRAKGFKNSTSKDGSLTIKLDPVAATIVKDFCCDRNLTCGDFVTASAVETVAKLTEESIDHMFDGMTKEEIIAKHKEIMAMNGVFPFNYLAMAKERDERYKSQEAVTEEVEE